MEEKGSEREGEGRGGEGRVGPPIGESGSTSVVMLGSLVKYQDGTPANDHPCTPH